LHIERKRSKVTDERAATGECLARACALRVDFDAVCGHGCRARGEKVSGAGGRIQHNVIATERCEVPLEEPL
jgi:hypothetical protein